MANISNDKLTFKIDLDGDKSTFVMLGSYEFEQLFHKYSMTFDEFCKMAAWFNDTSVAPENKIKFVPTLLKMIESIYIMTKIVQATGAPDKAIAENLSLPF